MVFIIKRREAVTLGAAAAAMAMARSANGQNIPMATATPPKLDIEKGASLRILRPARFVEPDEVIHVGVGNEDVVRTQQAGWSKGIVVAEVEQQGAFRPPHFNEQTRITEDIIDEEAGEGGVHIRDGSWFGEPGCGIRKGAMAYS